MENYIGIVVSHTHWDRAWYWSFQAMRVRLVETIDQIINVLESNKTFKCFVLDGQTILLEDYLEVKPESKERIKALVKAKKLLVGPWYVLMDEFLESPEAMIRNLLLGRKIASEFGHIMNEGYVPDSFGHISSLPKILAGFGIRSFIFTRGIGKEYDELGNEFWWKSSDGSKVLAIYQRDGYWNGASLGFDYEWGDYRFKKVNFQLALERIKKSFEKLKSGAKTKYILFNNGTDHAPIQPEVPQILRFINKNFKEIKLIQGSFSDLVDKIIKSNPDLKTFSGELNKNYHHPIVQNVYSTRIYLKQKNFTCQTLLEKYAESLTAFLFAETGVDLSPLVWSAWKMLLKNHPHDDICGCGIDEIHKDMEDRFRQVEQAARFIIWQAADRITSMIKISQNSKVLFVFNPINFKRKDLIKAKLLLDEKEFEDGFKLIDANGNEIAFDIISRKREFVMGILKGGFKIVFDIEFIAELPSTGYRIFYVVPRKPGERSKNSATNLKATNRKIENDFFVLTVSKNGTLRIKDKRNGKIYDNLNLFEDDEDAGDEYTYSHAVKCQKIFSSYFKPKITLSKLTSFKATIKIEYILNLPESLTTDFKSRSKRNKPCRLTTFITLYDCIDRIDIRTEFENNIKDHRLRVLFPTGIKTRTHFVDAHFEILERLNPYLDREVLNQKEKPYTTRHQNTFVAVSNDEHTFVIANRGLPEYEIIPSKNGDIIALTLLRGVGYLSRQNLHRIQPAGPEIQTPDAQCLGKHIFEYSIIPINQKFEKSKAHLKSYAFAFPPIAIFKSDDYPHRKKLPEQLSFLTSDSENVVLSSIKIAEDKKGIIVRFYNVGDKLEQVKCKLWRNFKIYTADLKEDKVNKVKTQDGEVNLTIGKKAILTLYLI